jgi:hypothetical protein
MYKEHRGFTMPVDQDTKISKYLDFTKFISMLETDSLYFARADKLTDRHEGAFTRTDRPMRVDIKVPGKTDPENAIRNPHFG